MLIHMLDPGRRSGYALGLAGAIPRSGFVELRQPKEHRAIGCGNLIAYLAQVWNYQKPDLVGWEEPMGAAWWAQMAIKSGRMHNPDSLEGAHELSGVLQAMCSRYGIRFETVRRQTVLKHITGTSKHGSREAGKKAVIDACIRMKLVEPGCKDDDRCDAVANFAYASATFARKPIGDFQLFS